jgi:fructose-1-phosphate kinase PfkB-like protein
MNSKSSISTTKFPAKLNVLLSHVPHVEYETLAEVFQPVLALEDHVLLTGSAPPPAIQLRMTAYLLRRSRHLIEEVQADTKTEQMLMTAALQCRPLETRRKA